MVINDVEHNLEESGSDAIACLLSGLFRFVRDATMHDLHIIPPTVNSKRCYYAAFVRVKGSTKEIAWGIGLDVDLTTAILQGVLIAATHIT